MYQVIKWLLEGDVSIQFQTKRDLLQLGMDELEKLQRRITHEGWGKAFLSKRNDSTGQWGGGWYTPKWTSTHYTLLLLKKIGIHPDTKQYKESASLLLDAIWFNQGLVTKDRYQDMCVSGMLLGICCYTKIQSPKIKEIVDYIIDKHYTDGGWNCRWYAGDSHSSLHTTLSILEGIREYIKNDYNYRANELIQQKNNAHEFILRHHIFRSERTGKIIKNQFTMLSLPDRWYYNILRCLDYFQSIDLSYDIRMKDAIELLIKKRRKNDLWPVQYKIHGLIHFDMEESGKESRWNTLRALRVLSKYGKANFRVYN